MVRKQRAIVGVFITVLVFAVCATPVHGITAYSEQCDTTWEYDIFGLSVDQYYDDQVWDPESNSSQIDRFWSGGEDVNISLSLLFKNEHIGLHKTLDFYYWVDVTTLCPPDVSYKIIEGSSSSSNESYDNTVEVDYQDEDTRDLFIEVYSVYEETAINVWVDVYVYDGEQILDQELILYYWQGIF